MDDDDDDDDDEEEDDDDDDDPGQTLEFVLLVFCQPCHLTVVLEGAKIAFAEREDGICNIKPVLLISNSFEDIQGMIHVHFLAAVILFNLCILPHQAMWNGSCCCHFRYKRYRHRNFSAAVGSRIREWDSRCPKVGCNAADLPVSLATKKRSVVPGWCRQVPVSTLI